MFEFKQYDLSKPTEFLFLADTIWNKSRNPSDIV